jgi:hypothetical protein
MLVASVAFAACAGPRGSGLIPTGTTSAPASTAATPSPSTPTRSGLSGAALIEAYVAFWQSPLVLHAEVSEVDGGSEGNPETTYATALDLDGADWTFSQTRRQSAEITIVASILLDRTAYNRQDDAPWTAAARAMIVPPSSRTILMLAGTDDSAKLRDAGVEMLDGRALHRLEATSPLSRNQGMDTWTYETFNAWVEADGTPVLARGSTARGSIEIRISLVGGPIDIRPPAGVPAVTPAPFVTPAPPPSPAEDPIGWYRYVSPFIGYSVALPPSLPFEYTVPRDEHQTPYDRYWGSLSSAGPFALLYVMCKPVSATHLGGASPSLRPDLVVNGASFQLDRAPGSAGADQFVANGLKGGTTCMVYGETDDSDAAWAIFRQIVSSFWFPSPTFTEPTSSPGS